MAENELRHLGQLRFSCKCKAIKHEYLCALNQSPKECPLGSRVYFTRRGDALQKVYEQVSLISQRLNVSQELTQELLLQIFTTCFETKGRKIDPYSSLSFFLQDNTPDVIAMLLRRLKVRLDALQDPGQFWAWYFEINKSKFRNLRTASATPLRSVFYKYDFSMFLDDLVGENLPIEIPGNDQSSRLLLLQNQFIHGNTTWVNKVVSEFSKNGASALSIRSELALVEYSESQKRLSRMLQKHGAVPEEEGSHFVRDSGKGGINRWNYY